METIQALFSSSLVIHNILIEIKDPLTSVQVTDEELEVQFERLDINEMIQGEANYKDRLRKHGMQRFSKLSRYLE